MTSASLKNYFACALAIIIFTAPLQSMPPKVAAAQASSRREHLQRVLVQRSGFDEVTRKCTISQKSLTHFYTTDPRVKNYTQLQLVAAYAAGQIREARDAQQKTAQKLDRRIKELKKQLPEDDAEKHEIYAQIIAERTKDADELRHYIRQLDTLFNVLKCMTHHYEYLSFLSALLTFGAPLSFEKLDLPASINLKLFAQDISLADYKKRTLALAQVAQKSILRDVQDMFSPEKLLEYSSLAVLFDDARRLIERNATVCVAEQLSMFFAECGDSSLSPLDIEQAKQTLIDFMPTNEPLQRMAKDAPDILWGNIILHIAWAQNFFHYLAQIIVSQEIVTLIPKTLGHHPTIDALSICLSDKFFADIRMKQKEFCGIIPAPVESDDATKTDDLVGKQAAAIQAADALLEEEAKKEAAEIKRKEQNRAKKERKEKNRLEKEALETAAYQEILKPITDANVLRRQIAGALLSAAEQRRAENANAFYEKNLQLKALRTLSTNISQQKADYQKAIQAAHNQNVQRGKFVDSLHAVSEKQMKIDKEKAAAEEETERIKLNKQIAEEIKQEAHRRLQHHREKIKAEEEPREQCRRTQQRQAKMRAKEEKRILKAAAALRPRSASSLSFDSQSDRSTISDHDAPPYSSPASAFLATGHINHPAVWQARIDLDAVDRDKPQERKPIIVQCCNRLLKEGNTRIEEHLHPAYRHFVFVLLFNGIERLPAEYGNTLYANVTQEHRKILAKEIPCTYTKREQWIRTAFQNKAEFINEFLGHHPHTPEYEDALGSMAYYERLLNNGRTAEDYPAPAPIAVATSYPVFVPVPCYPAMPYYVTFPW